MSSQQAARQGLPRIVAAASIGTAFEWYDFFLFGSLAAVLAKHFFSAASESAGFLLALGTFAAAPLMRPLGALVFGHFGDRTGRKRSFLVTVTIMGSATFLIGLLPTYSQIGATAPLLLVGLRLLQGFALGGEYGGAATYVAEHARPRERGWLTAWIQASAAFGLIGALSVTFGTRLLMGEDAFESWGWRIPFWISAALLVFSLWMRASLRETPVFTELAEQGKVCRAPLSEAFLRWPNLKRVLLVLVGVTMAQGVVWYSAFFYTHFFLERVLKVDAGTVNLLLLLGACASVFLYLFFGRLSDMVGRKPVMLFGMALAAATIFPVFEGMSRAANPALHSAQQMRPVVVAADLERCSLLFDPLGKRRFESGCDLARLALADAGVPYRSEAARLGSVTIVRIGADNVAAADAPGMATAELKAARADLSGKLKGALQRAGYPAAADPARVDFWRVFALLMVLVVAASALYGPQAAWLIEMFPARIRYSAMSLPLHIGGGWFGGLLPAIAFAIVAATGDIFSGLWWPMFVAGTGALVTFFFIPETLEPKRAEGKLRAAAVG